MFPAGGRLDEHVFLVRDLLVLSEAEGAADDESEEDSAQAGEPQAVHASDPTSDSMLSKSSRCRVGDQDRWHMLAMLVLAATLMGQDALGGHVRATDPGIAAIIAAGLLQSATFRRLVETLDRSDVIVYVVPKIRRPGLRGYLAHGVVSRG